MAKKSGERLSTRGGSAHCRVTCTAISALVTASTAYAQAPVASFSSLGVGLGQVMWIAVTIGTALAALLSSWLLLRNRPGDRLAAAEAEIVALRSALDRTEALLDTDDQRTIVWDSAVANPRIFGALSERVGAPAASAAFLAFKTWLVPASAEALEAAADRLRREGEPFQLAVRTPGGALLEATGRTSGRRAVMRLRELTGERRSFAELKEQTLFVINEMTSLRALADMLPLPMWRRNRTGRLTWVNRAYIHAVDAQNQEAVLASGIELLPARIREAIRETTRNGSLYRDTTTAIVAGDRRQVQVLDGPVEDGSIGYAIDVSEVNTLKEELERVKDSHARALDQLTAGVAVFDKNGRLLFHNAAFRDTWGLPSEFLTPGLEESALLDQLRADRKLQEQANFRDWRARHLAAYNDTNPREELWHLPDGRTLRLVAMPSADGGMTYIYENVTERIVLESRLKALSQLQGETLDHLSEAVTVFGMDARLRLFNPAFAEIWRLSPARLRQEPHVNEIIADCQAIHADTAAWEAIRAAVTDLEHGDHASGRMERPDGSAIDYATVALPEGMTMLTFVDVTASTRMERVLKERNEALEAADRLKSEFIQHVSYELRSPLQTIIGFSELLTEAGMGSLSPQHRDYVEHIESSSRALLALINDILDLATVDAGIMSLDIREIDIARLVASSVEGVRDRLSEQGIDLLILVPKNIGSLQADEQRVRQILFNLVSNAIRFSNAGGHIRVEAKKRGGWAVFTVTDDGVGIPKEVMPHVFRSFETHVTKGRRAGAGLGLSIVKSLVELHGGEINLVSEEGKGTTATVRLPVAPTAAVVAAA
jgi:signal transduction histidine kinase